MEMNLGFTAEEIAADIVGPENLGRLKSAGVSVINTQELLVLAKISESVDGMISTLSRLEEEGDAQTDGHDPGRDDRPGGRVLHEG